MRGVCERPKLIDRVEGFHAAYRGGRTVAPPDEYMDLILIPQALHIDPLTFAGYPPQLQGRIRHLLLINIAQGWAGKMEVIDRG